MPRILRLSLRSFCSSSVSTEPSSTSEPASGTTLKAIGATYFSGAGKSTRRPSWVSSAALSTTALDLRVAAPRRRPARCRTPPGRCEAISRTSPASSCSGLSTGIAAMVVQFGLAMMPLRDLGATSPAG